MGKIHINDLNQGDINISNSIPVYDTTDGDVKIVDSNDLAKQEDLDETNELLFEITNEVEYIFPKNYGDVESGDFCLIKTIDKVILIDCYRSDCWTEFKKDLLSEGISHIDYLIITHYHTDHCSNFANLYNNNFIDTNTNIILPKYSSYYMGLYPTVNNYYTTIKSLCDSNNLNYKFANEGDLIELDNFKIEIYNTNIDYYESLTTNYNATSIVQLISHGDIKILLSGDAQPETLEYLLNNVELPKIDLYKVEHHGINNETYIPFFERIRPTYSVQPIGLKDYATKVLSSRSQTLLWLYNNGCINYGTGISNKLVKFKSTSKKLTVEQGTPFSPNKRAFYNSKTIYVNANATNDYVQDGSANKPFKNLAQAIAGIDKNTFSQININLADGTYTAQNSYNNVTRLYDISGEIVITGNTTDNSQVVLEDGFDIINCSNVTIQGVTIYNNNQRGIGVLGSNVFLEKVKITNKNNTQATRANIFVKNGKLTVNNSELSYSEKAIHTKYSDIVLSGVTFTNNDTNMFFEYSSYTLKNITVDDNSSTYLYNNTSQNSKPPFASCSIGDYTTTTLNSEFLPITANLVNDESCLKIENNAIVINYGVPYAFVSGTILIESGQEAGNFLTFSIRQNGGYIAEIQHRMSGTGNESIVIPPTFVSLGKGDKITVSIRSHSKVGAVIKGGRSYSNLTLFACN